MSELKMHHINEVMDMHNLTRGKMGFSIVYYADDVDKVIAEKDEEIAKLKQKNNDFRYTIALLCKEKNHHKFRRCLAMVKMCKARYVVEDVRVNSHRASWDYTESEEMKYWERWQKRWLELAEKFKEVK